MQYMSTFFICLTLFTTSSTYFVLFLIHFFQILKIHIEQIKHMYYLPLYQTIYFHKKSINEKISGNDKDIVHMCLIYIFRFPSIIRLIAFFSSLLCLSRGIWSNSLFLRFPTYIITFPSFMKISRNCTYYLLCDQDRSDISLCFVLF